MAACLVILEFVNLELSYDSFHAEKDRVYRTVTKSVRAGVDEGSFPLSGYAQGPSLVQDYPEVVSYCRLHPQYGGAVLTTGEGDEQKQFFEEEMFYVDSTFFDFFTFELISGDDSKALAEPKSIILTESYAQKYFGEADPMGRTIRIDGGWDEGEYKVTGVLMDPPQNSHLKFNFLMSITDLLNNSQYLNDDGWGWSNFYTYVMLNQQSNRGLLEEKLPEFVTKYEGERLARSDQEYIISLQPIEDIHLTPGLEEDFAATRNASTVYSFGIIALFILLIAWVNYINLSTARALERAREVGIKKVVGSTKYQLVSQFLLESFILNLAAMIIAVLLAFITIPYLGNIIGKSLSISFLTNVKFWISVAGILLTGTFLAGLYPAFILASYRPSAVLKSSQTKAGSGLVLRKVLVVFQFAASLILIAGTLTVFRQISFLRSQDLGLNLDKVIVVKGPAVLPEDISFSNTFSTFRNEVSRNAGISSISSSGAVPGGEFNWGTSIRKSGDDESQAKGINVTWVDDKFFETYDIEILSGRIWNLEQEADRERVIINETAVNTFGMGDANKALDEMFVLGTDTLEIIAVTEDYNWKSLRKENVPIILAPTRAHSSYFSFKLNTNDYQAAIASIQEAYATMFPGNPFDYFFIDEYFNSQYKADQQFGTIFSVFSVLAIFVACLGLSGLASYTALQKTREIGVRKVLGASTSSIMILSTRSFVILIGIAMIISVPLLYYGMQNWLEGYAYHIPITADLFFLPIIVLMLITIATVALNTLKTARLNPANSLRAE